MQGYNSYKSGILNSWTRVEMLIALYDRAIDDLTKARDLEDSNAGDSKLLVVHAQRVILELIRGIDLNQGEVPQKINQLLISSLHFISENDKKTAIMILENLRSGFDQVRPEAIELEHKGVIPSLDAARAVETVA